MVYQRLRQSPRGSSTFTEEDRAWLAKLCRLDLIQLIEVDLGLGPLKTSQKNSVHSMLDWLLKRRDS